MNSIHNKHKGATRIDASQVLERLFELATLLTEGLEGGLTRRELTQARAEVLWRLHHQGPMTQRALSEMLRCTPRNMTGLVDALESAGFVARGPHPSDRRATLVTLTERGKNAAAEMQAESQTFAAFLFADLTNADLNGFATTLEQLLRRLHDTTHE